LEEHASPDALHDGLQLTGFEDLGIFATLNRFKLASLICLAMTFSAAADGYQVRISVLPTHAHVRRPDFDLADRYERKHPRQQRLRRPIRDPDGCQRKQVLSCQCLILMGVHTKCRTVHRDDNSTLVRDHILRAGLRMDDFHLQPPLFNQPCQPLRAQANPIRTLVHLGHEHPLRNPRQNLAGLGELGFPRNRQGTLHLTSSCHSSSQSFLPASVLAQSVSVKSRCHASVSHHDRSALRIHHPYLRLGSGPR
jgi:hypothetical protein